MHLVGLGKGESWYQKDTPVAVIHQIPTLGFEIQKYMWSTSDKIPL